MERRDGKDKEEKSRMTEKRSRERREIESEKIRK